jgi:hypothetical protein
MQSGAAFASGSPMSRFNARHGRDRGSAHLHRRRGDLAKSLLRSTRVRRCAIGKGPGDAVDARRAFYQLLTAPRGPFWSDARKDDANSIRRHARRSRRNVPTPKRCAKRRSTPIPCCQAIQEGGTPKSLFPAIQDVPVHIRGRYDRLGDVVPRHFPQVIAASEQSPSRAAAGRLELAKWLASPGSPAHRRVMVNRIWQHHFGEGHRPHAEQLRKARHAPTHPNWLDHLASSSSNPAGRSRRCTAR